MTPKTEELYGELRAMQTPGNLGPYEKASERIALYVVCRGTGAVHVEVSGVAKLDQQCSTDPADPGTRNTFDVGHVDQIEVTASVDGSDKYAIALTHISAREG